MHCGYAGASAIAIALLREAIVEDACMASYIIYTPWAINGSNISYMRPPL
jgi:hypothetical protein